MSKPSSGYFQGTKGTRVNSGKSIASPEQIIFERTKGLDLSPHPRKSKTMSAKQMRSIRRKIISRTASKAEYKAIKSEQRFRARRASAIEKFWQRESVRIKNGNPTRQWTSSQIQDIVNKKRPKFKGKTIQGHHTFSVQQYPHLANNPDVIFPATHTEHFRGWHGGNYKRSVPGKRIKPIQDF